MVDQLGLFPAYLTPAPEPPPEGTLAGLTLWQPWAWAVAHGGKRTENRPWKPWPSIVGKLVAIHAAAKVDVAEEARAAEFIRTKVGLVVPEASTLPRGAIVAVARVTGCVTASADPWFFGPFGWTLTDVVALPTPLPCRGMQGLWPVPGEVARVALATWREVYGGACG